MSKSYSGESKISICISISPKCSKRERGAKKKTGIRTRVKSWPKIKKKNALIYQVSMTLKYA